jgi:hypothetical protein
MIKSFSGIHVFAEMKDLNCCSPHDTREKIVEAFARECLGADEFHNLLQKNLKKYQHSVLMAEPGGV